MKLLFALSILAVAVLATSLKAHGKEYQTKSADFERATLFHKEDAEIKKHNKGNHTYKRAHNKFSDMTEEEKEAHLGGSLPSDLERSLLPLFDFTEDRALSATYDLRTDVCLAAVKDQKQCGSCWAYATITPLEFAACKKNKNVGTDSALSEQQLVDCDPNDKGCNGGFYTRAWGYMQKAGGSAKQSLYSYTSPPASTCKFTSSMVGAKVSSYGGVASNATAIQAALQRYGPIPVAISIASSFYSYSSGVYTDKKCDSLGIAHAVVIVGWGTQSGINYCVVRNSWVFRILKSLVNAFVHVFKRGSWEVYEFEPCRGVDRSSTSGLRQARWVWNPQHWGTGWGTKGYILMQRGVNKCLIESYAAYVVAF